MQNLFISKSPTFRLSISSSLKLPERDTGNEEEGNADAVLAAPFGGL